MPIGSAFRNTSPASSPAQRQPPPSGTALVFARLASLLRSSPALHGATILAWDDPTRDASMPGDEGPSYIRLTPSPATGKPYCRGAGGLVHKCPMTVAVETSTPGTNVADSMRLWETILAAIFPAAGQLAPSLRSLGVSYVRIDKPAWGPAPAGSARCQGAGSITLDLYYATPE